MAHLSNNRSGRKRETLPNGTRIAMMVNGKLLKGTVGGTDGGDWIYPSGIPGAPSWCRASQVIVLDKKETK